MMKKNLKLATFFLFSMIFLSSFSNNVAKSQNFSPKKSRKIEKIISKMTLKEKIGQLFVIRPESLDPDYSLEQVHKAYDKGSLSLNRQMIKQYEKYPAGGFILFNRNIKSPEQTLNFTQEIHGLKGVKPFIYVDEEGGKVARLAQTKNFNLPTFTDARSIGESHQTQKAFEEGFEIGSYLKKYGFDVDFAPIADVDTNPKNPVIGRRAFSDSPKEAGQMALAFYKGLEKAGIKGCFKHFPGHGDTLTDTHKGYAEVCKTWEEMLECELLPFKTGIENGVQIIMTAHITAPKVDPSNTPASLSKILLQDKLRKELGFEGIIITDALEMGAITNQYSPGQAAIMAIQAGADLLLIPYDYTSTFEALEEAVKDGSISEKRIDQSIRRILSMKGY